MSFVRSLFRSILSLVAAPPWYAIASSSGSAGLTLEALMHQCPRIFVPSKEAAEAEDPSHCYSLVVFLPKSAETLAGFLFFFFFFFVVVVVLFSFCLYSVCLAFLAGIQCVRAGSNALSTLIKVYDITSLMVTRGN
jgi:hypothetical protein